MKTAAQTENYFAAALATVALLLIGVLFWEWDEGMQLKSDLLKMRIIPDTAVPPQIIQPEFKLPAAEIGFPELLSRPLFSVSRRPANSVDRGGGAMKKGQFVLVGVMIAPQRRAALLRDRQTNKTESVALIGVVRGLTLGEVEPSRVVLRQGAESEELMLNVQVGSKLPIPAPIPTTRPPAVPVSPAVAASVPSPTHGASGVVPQASAVPPPAKSDGAASAPKVPVPPPRT